MAWERGAGKGREGAEDVDVDYAPLDFLAQALTAGLPTIVLIHHAVLPLEARWMDRFLADDMDPFWKALTGHEVLGILSGHLHNTYEQLVHNIPVLGLRSTMFQFAVQDEPLITLLPPQYRLVTVHDGVLTSRVFEVEL
jgi:Icc protein